MTTVRMNASGLEPLSLEDCLRVNGGALPPLIPAALAYALLVSFINNFQDVREGLYDGYHGTPRYSTRPALFR